MTPGPVLPNNDDTLIATEVVYIDSSPINLAGLPRPRVLKRKSNCYMLPTSPSSPTLRSVGGNSGGRVARRLAAGTKTRRDFAQTDGKYCLFSNKLCSIRIIKFGYFLHSFRD